ncbi:MAG: DNA-binding protein [Planctomycetaceae bacterium]|nr:DNA-binding protein [Planctomycetaceae bacterium]
MSNVEHALFVAWQNPISRSFYPVARLAQVVQSVCSECFEFVYIQNARDAEGFQPFSSFPDFKQIYRSKELFPLFANRVPSSNRSDYQEYLRYLGLPDANNSPITLLSRSSGQRRTDTLELFPLPTFEPDFGYRTWFWSHGIRHLESSNQERVLKLAKEEEIFPSIDQSNTFDSQAIKLLSNDQIHIGFMPSYLLDDAHTLQEMCQTCEIFVERVNPSPAPVQQRLLCRLESCWPDGFIPYSSTKYQPIPQDAASILPPVFDREV